MKPSDRLREEMGALMKLGVTQKTIAARIGVSESTLSRWYRREPDSKGRPAKIPVEALDAFEAYLGEFTSFMQTRETQRAAAPSSTTAGSLQRTGTYHGPERRTHGDTGQGPAGERRRTTDAGSS